MALIVKKFGGSSVADAECIRRVAGIIAASWKDGNQVVVVLSAQGDTTDDLLEKAAEINPNASKREMDMLLHTGEIVSISLMAMELQRLGLPVVSLTGWQVGMETSSAYGNARISKISGTRIQEELDRNRIVLVAGFQGINKYGDITTLGRGGSDTTAVALAVALKADKCQIYTDVDGVYTADPRKCPEARKLSEITYDEMLELATLGAQVLHNRSVEMAKRYHVTIEVLSSFTGAPGTLVKEVAKKMEETYISGVAQDKNIARVALVGVENTPGVAYRIFSLLAKEKINVELIVQSIGRETRKDIGFIISQTALDAAKKLLEENKQQLGFEALDVEDHVALVSVVGSGMEGNPGVASTMFEALYEKHINIRMISTSEIKISVLVNIEDADSALKAVHRKFFG